MWFGVFCLTLVAWSCTGHGIAGTTSQRAASLRWSPESGGIFDASKQTGHQAGELYVSGKDRLLGGWLGLGCVAWRKSANCDPGGPRDIMDDKDCATPIGGLEAGFCECEGHRHTASVPCGHKPINCQNECGQLVLGFARPYPTTYPDPPDPDGHYVPKFAMTHDGDMDYWAHEATSTIEQAVIANHDGLADAKRMMDQLKNSKPWPEVDALGRQLVDDGKKAQIFSKVVPPVLWLRQAVPELRGKRPALPA